MKKITQISTAAAKYSIVLGLTLALVISGAGSAHRLFASFEAANVEAEETTSAAKLMPGPPDPSEAGGEMTPDGIPTTEQPALLLMPAWNLSGGPKDYIRQNDESASKSIDASFSEKSTSALFTSTGQVSTNLGHQFTLVGAKPSGTS